MPRPHRNRRTCGDQDADDGLSHTDGARRGVWTTELTGSGGRHQLLASLLNDVLVGPVGTSNKAQHTASHSAPNATLMPMSGNGSL